MDQYDHPTRALYDDIIRAFEFGSDGMNKRLTEAMHKGVINSAVFINPEREKLRTPQAQLETRQILLHGVHLSYTWAICWLIFKLQELTHDHILAEPSDKAAVAMKLESISPALSWAISLKRFGWSVWPDFLPSPSDNTEEVQAVNTMFLLTMRYIMYHEAAHLILHHNAIEFIRTSKSSNSLSQEEKRRLKMMEIQADDFALDTSFATGEAEVTRYGKVLGAIIAHLSTFYLLYEAKPSAELHADVDERLKRVVKTAKFADEQYEVFSGLAWTIGVQVFLHIHNVEQLADLEKNRPFETFDELGGALFSILSGLKDPR